jgi:hypothetical protein
MALPAAAARAARRRYPAGISEVHATPRQADSRDGTGLPRLAAEHPIKELMARIGSRPAGRALWDSQMPQEGVLVAAVGRLVGRGSR